MNLAGVPLMRLTRRGRRSRGLDFLALAIRTPLVPLATDDTLQKPRPQCSDATSCGLPPADAHRRPAGGRLRNQQERGAHESTLDRVPSVHSRELQRDRS
jgi:hypothetical protein